MSEPPRWVDRCCSANLLEAAACSFDWCKGRGCQQSTCIACVHPPACWSVPLTHCAASFAPHAVWQRMCAWAPCMHRWWPLHQASAQTVESLPLEQRRSEQAHISTTPTGHRFGPKPYSPSSLRTAPKLTQGPLLAPGFSTQSASFGGPPWLQGSAHGLLCSGALAGSRVQHAVRSAWCRFWRAPRAPGPPARPPAQRRRAAAAASRRNAGRAVAAPHGSHAAGPAAAAVAGGPGAAAGACSTA